MEDTTIESGFCVVDDDGHLREIKGSLPAEGKELMAILTEHEKYATLIKKGEKIEESKIYKVS